MAQAAGNEVEVAAGKKACPSRDTRYTYAVKKEILKFAEENTVVHSVFLIKIVKELIGDAEGYIFEFSSNPGKSYEVRTMTHCIKENFPHTPES